MKNSIGTLFSTAILSLVTTSLHAEVQTKEITYTQGDTNLVGYIAYDDKYTGKRPGILVVHEWWGHNEYVRKRARMLAELGYVAFALDMYGEGKVTDHPKEAGKFASKLRNDMPLARTRFNAALKQLGNHPKADPNKMAAIGYCFGGGVVLEMAREGADLDAVVSFHGSLGTANPAQKGKVKSKVLVFNGAADPFVKPEAIAKFKSEMTQAGVDYEFVNYPGVKHSFTNPDADMFAQKYDMPLAYSKDADLRSWQKMQDLFATLFK